MQLIYKHSIKPWLSAQRYGLDYLPILIVAGLLLLTYQELRKQTSYLINPIDTMVKQHRALYQIQGATFSLGNLQKQQTYVLQAGTANHYEDDQAFELNSVKLNGKLTKSTLNLQAKQAYLTGDFNLLTLSQQVALNLNKQIKPLNSSNKTIENWQFTSQEVKFLPKQDQFIFNQPFNLNVHSKQSTESQSAGTLNKRLAAQSGTFDHVNFNGEFKQVKLWFAPKSPAIDNVQTQTQTTAPSININNSTTF